MTKKICFLVFLFIFCNTISVAIASLKKQQTAQLFEIYKTHRLTFFCDQAFHSDGYLSLPIKIQWMPIVPLQKLASHLSCYRDKRCLDKSGKLYGGLRCCQKTDPLFIKMSTDLYNYVPEEPSISRLRRHFVFDDFENIQSPHSSCHFYIDSQNKRLSPAPHTRGVIARTYLYFHQQYQLPLSEKELILFQRWHKMYPISDWERKRGKLIFDKQNTANPLLF